MYFTSSGAFFVLRLVSPLSRCWGRLCRESKERVVQDDDVMHFEINR